jgi:hypothetical protein
VAAALGMLRARALPSSEIAKIIGHGATADSVDAMAQALALPRVQRGLARIEIPVAIGTLSPLGQRACEEGVDPAEWCRQVAVAAIRDDLYATITDGKFDQKAGNTDDSGSGVDRSSSVAISPINTA